MNRRLAIVALLTIAVVVSAIAAVYTEHRKRQLFVERQKLNDKADELNIEWGRLRLEQGTWATHARVERLARDELALRMPERDDIIFVERARMPDGENGHER